MLKTTNECYQQTGIVRQATGHVKVRSKAIWDGERCGFQEESGSVCTRRLQTVAFQCIGVLECLCEFSLIIMQTEFVCTICQQVQAYWDRWIVNKQTTRRSNIHAPAAVDSFSIISVWAQDEEERTHFMRLNQNAFALCRLEGGGNCQFKSVQVTKNNHEPYVEWYTDETFTYILGI